MAYRIRKVDGFEYRAELRTLHDATFGDEAPMPRFAKGDWWIVTYMGEPVAFAGMEPGTLYRRYAYFHRVGVMPAHRGQGLQRKLMRRLELEARAQGYAGLMSDTNSAYSGNNFIRTGWKLFEPKHPWALKSSYYWRKNFRVCL